jgi:hypothetical protein
MKNTQQRYKKRVHAFLIASLFFRIWNRSPLFVPVLASCLLPRASQLFTSLLLYASICTRLYMTLVSLLQCLSSTCAASNAKYDRPPEYTRMLRQILSLIGRLGTPLFFDVFTYWEFLQPFNLYFCSWHKLDTVYLQRCAFFSVLATLYWA